MDMHRFSELPLVEICEAQGVGRLRPGQECRQFPPLGAPLSEMEHAAELQSVGKHVIAEEVRARTGPVIGIEPSVSELKGNQLSKTPVQHRLDLSAEGRTRTKAADIPMDLNRKFRT